MELNYEKTLLTVNEASLLTGINPSTVRQWVGSGRIDATKELIDGHYTLLLDRNDVLELLKTFRGKIHTKDEIKQMICDTKERARNSWEKYKKIGPVTDRKWNIDKPIDMDKAKEETKERQKQYRSENKEKEIKRNKKYYSENKEMIKEYKKKYRSENKEKEIKRNKKYYSENKEKINEQRRKRYTEKKREEETK